jgi:hypothetical protein
MMRIGVVDVGGEVETRLIRASSLLCRYVPCRYVADGCVVCARRVRLTADASAVETADCHG